MSLSFQSALDYANADYLANRAEYAAKPLAVPTPAEEKIIQRNKRKAFYDNLSAERQWENRHKSRP